MSEKYNNGDLYNQLADMLISMAELLRDSLKTQFNSEPEAKEDTADSLQKVKPAAVSNKAANVKLEVVETETATPTPEVNEEKTMKGHLTKEQLDSMAFNDLKKLAANMGVKAVGTRNTITNSILSVEVEVSAQEKDNKKAIVKDAPKPVKPVNTKGGLKVPSKEQAQEEQEEEPDELYDMVNAYSDEDLKEVLKSIGKSTVGKHESLVDKVIRAINEGLIGNPLDEEAENETQEDNEEVDTNDAQDMDDDITSIADMFPVFAVNYSDDMTEARKEALASIDDEIVNNDEVEYDESELDEAIYGFLNDDYDRNEFSVDIKVMIYAEMRKLFIDDDGEEHDDKDPYQINGEAYCCGTPLEYSKKLKKFVCGICGNKYDAE